MMLASQGQIDSVTNFLSVLLIFLFVIAITWFATRYMASIQKQKMDTSNIEIVETARIGQNKYLQIIRAGEKYLLIAVGKDNVTMLTELTKEELQIKTGGQTDLPVNFSAILSNVMKKKNDKTEEEKQANQDE